MSARIASLAALVLASIALSACATPTPEPEAEAVTSPRLYRVVVAPLNVPVRAPAELEGKGEPVWQDLLRYFQERDRQVAVLSPISAERLWLEATADLDVSDRSAALRVAYSRLAQALAAHRDFDLFVVPSLVLRPAHLSGWHAYWDGVQRIVPKAGILTSGRMFEMSGATTIRVAGLRGKVAAVSLHVVVLRPDGSRVSEGLGGLDVLQEARRDDDADSKLRFTVREEPFADPDAVREGVMRAFQGPLLTASGAP